MLRFASSSPNIGIAAQRELMGKKATAKTQGEDHIPVLDGVRGLAVFMVFCFHVWLGAVKGTQLGAGLPFYSHIVQFGATGVDLFFVLSGFLITSILYKTREMPHFYRAFFARRVIRIFPLYYLCLVLYFLVTPLGLRIFGREDLLADPMFNAPAFLIWTYTTNWLPFFPGATPIPPILQHFWSLAVEEQFYVTWPWIVKKLKRQQLMILCLCLMAVSFALRQYFVSQGAGFLAYKWTFCVMDDLAAGAFIGLAFRDGGDRKSVIKAAPWFFGGAFLCLAFLPQPVFGWIEITGFAVLYASGIAIVIGLNEDALPARTLASKPLRFLGKHSYAMYLFHQPIICILARNGINADTINEKTGNALLAILALNGIILVLSVFSSWGIWHIFEKHFLKLKSRPLFNPDPTHRKAGTVKIT